MSTAALLDAEFVDEASARGAARGERSSASNSAAGGRKGQGKAIHNKAGMEKHGAGRVSRAAQRSGPGQDRTLRVGEGRVGDARAR